MNSWRVTGSRLARAAALGLALTLAAAPSHGAEADKVFRYAFEIAETSFDPHPISDVYSIIVTDSIFDTPLAYDYLARPLKLRPRTLASMPEISADGMTYTMRVKPGIYFADDPVFRGKKRELTAEDYVYSMKRLLDPKVRASQLGEIEGYIAGSDEALAKARKANKFDYDAPIEGLKSLDRYTWQIKLTKPLYVFIHNLADCRVSCAMAREVVEHYGDDVGSHPVGTGPYRLAFWKRSSKIVLETHSNYREEYFDGEPAEDDAEGREILRIQKGKRLPIVPRVEISIIEETQPRWLSFLNGGLDLIFGVPNEFANQAIPNNKLAPNLAKRGIRMAQVAALDLTYTYFNMEDPVVGGYTPDKVALRRAITLAYNTRDEISILRKNQAIPAQAPYSPGVAGHDPAFRTTANEHSVSKAKALLDMFGYVDRDGDGFREAPDGSRLELKSNSTPSASAKQLDELWKRSMDDIGLRISFRKANWPDLNKEANNAKLMMWGLGGSASMPDADTWLQSLYGPNEGEKGNLARFKLAAYDRLFERARAMPDSPERTRLYQEMTKLVIAYAPWKLSVHRINTDLWHPHVIGYRRPLIMSRSFFKYIDLDDKK